MPMTVNAAARALLDALGGMPIDWLRDEAAALEDALDAEDSAACSPEALTDAVHNAAKGATFTTGDAN